METYYLIFDHENDEYSVMSEQQFLSAGDNIEYVQADESEEYLTYQATSLNGYYTELEE